MRYIFNILYLDLGADYMCKSSPSCSLRICAAYYVKVIPQFKKREERWGMKEERKKMKERMKGRKGEREGRKRDRDEYDLQGSSSKIRYWVGTVVCILKTRPRRGLLMCSVSQSGCVTRAEAGTPCARRQSLCFSTYYLKSPPPRKVTPRNASLNWSFLGGKDVYLTSFSNRKAVRGV